MAWLLLWCARELVDLLRSCRGDLDAGLLFELAKWTVEDDLDLSIAALGWSLSPFI